MDAISTVADAALPKAGGTMTGALIMTNTGCRILDSNASHELVIVPGSDLTADRNFTITTGDAARTFTMTGDLAMSGAFNLTLTTTALTNVTLPTTGTLATLAGVESLSNKTLVAPAIGTPASGVLTNCTGLPNASVIGLGTAALINTGSANSWAGAQAFPTGTTYNSLRMAHVASGSATGTGKISWGTASPGTLAEGEIYLQYSA